MTGSVFGLPGMEGPKASITEEHALNGWAAGRDRRHGGFSDIPDASFVSGQAIAVDGGYTAGRDHGVVQLFGLPR